MVSPAACWSTICPSGLLNIHGEPNVFNPGKDVASIFWWSFQLAPWLSSYWLRLPLNLYENECSRGFKSLSVGNIQDIGGPYWRCTLVRVISSSIHSSLIELDNPDFVTRCLLSVISWVRIGQSSSGGLATFYWSFSLYMEDVVELRAAVCINNA